MSAQIYAPVRVADVEMMHLLVKLQGGYGLHGVRMLTRDKKLQNNVDFYCFCTKHIEK